MNEEMKQKVKQIIHKLKLIEEDLLIYYEQTQEEGFYFACLGLLNAINELKKVVADVERH